MNSYAEYFDSFFVNIYESLSSWLKIVKKIQWNMG